MPVGTARILHIEDFDMGIPVGDCLDDAPRTVLRAVVHHDNAVAEGGYVGQCPGREIFLVPQQANAYDAHIASQRTRCLPQ